jgi:hypothetical protein
MSFHRFIVTVDVTVAIPGASDEPGTPADADLSAAVAAALDTATKKKVKATHQQKQFTVEKVETA